MVNMALTVEVGNIADVPQTVSHQFPLRINSGTSDSHKNVTEDPVTKAIILSYKTIQLFAHQAHIQNMVVHHEAPSPGIVYTGNNVQGFNMVLMPKPGYVGACIQKEVQPAWAISGSSVVRIPTGASLKIELYVAPLANLTTSELTTLGNTAYSTTDLYAWRTVWFGWSTSSPSVSWDNDDHSIGSHAKLNITNGYSIRYKPGKLIEFLYHDNEGEFYVLDSRAPNASMNEPIIEFTLLDRGRSGISVISDIYSTGGGIDVANPHGCLANDAVPCALFESLGLSGIMFSVLDFESSGEINSSKFWYPKYSEDVVSKLLVNWTAHENAQAAEYCHVGSGIIETEDPTTGKNMMQIYVWPSTDSSIFTPFIYGNCCITQESNLQSATATDLSDMVTSISRRQSLDSESTTLELDVIAPTSLDYVVLPSEEIIEIATNPVYNALHGRILWPITVNIDGIAFFKGFITGCRETYATKGASGNCPVFRYNISCQDYTHLLSIVPIMSPLDFRGMSMKDALLLLLTNIIKMDLSNIILEGLDNIILPESSKHDVLKPKYGTSLLDVIRDLHQLTLGQSQLWGFTWLGKFYSIPLPDRWGYPKRFFYYSYQDAAAANSPFYLRQPFEESLGWEHGSFANEVQVYSKSGLGAIATDYRSIFDPTYPWWIGRKISSYHVFEQHLTQEQLNFVCATIFQRITRFKDTISFMSAYDPSLAVGDIVAIYFPNGNSINYRIIDMEAVLDRSHPINSNNDFETLAQYSLVVAWW